MLEIGVYFFSYFCATLWGRYYICRLVCIIVQFLQSNNKDLSTWFNP